MSSDETRFSLGGSIPVLRMLDEAAAKAFYVEYLGFEIDWEHRFHDDASSPLYMQIHHGDAVLHLDGHAGPDAPVSDVRIPVAGLERYRDHLHAKDASYEKPEVVDPRGEGSKTDMSVMDPSENHLIFWSARVGS